MPRALVLLGLSRGSTEPLGFTFFDQDTGPWERSITSVETSEFSLGIPTFPLRLDMCNALSAYGSMRCLIREVNAGSQPNVQPPHAVLPFSATVLFAQ